MNATQGNRRSLRVLMLVAAAAGLALSASGCIIDGSSAPPDSDRDGFTDPNDLCPFQAEDFNGVQDDDGCPEINCLPDLTIPWRIFRNSTTTLLTCSQAGGADTVTAFIDGGAFGTTVNTFTGACPPSASSGSLFVELPATGTYGVSLELTAGATLLSETPILDIFVDCGGQTTTLVADLDVNF